MTLPSLVHKRAGGTSSAWGPFHLLPAWLLAVSCWRGALVSPVHMAPVSYTSAQVVAAKRNHLTL